MTESGWPTLYECGEGTCPKCGKAIHVFRSDETSYALVCLACDHKTMFFETEGDCWSALDDGRFYPTDEVMVGN